MADFTRWLHLHDEFRMIEPVSLLVLGLITVAGALFAYRALRPLQRRRKDYDAGEVSEHWLQHQRGESKDY